MSINSFRSFLYTLARLLGDVQAIERGPGAVVKRVERRIIGRSLGRLLRKIIR